MLAAAFAAEADPFSLICAAFAIRRAICFFAAIIEREESLDAIYAMRCRLCADAVT